jgi:hypothetical protein
MAIVKRKFSPQMRTLAEQVNAARVTDVGSNKHRDASERIVTAPTADTPTKAITLANDIRRIYMFHYGDDVAHKAVDATNTIALVGRVAVEQQMQRLDLRATERRG